MPKDVSASETLGDLNADDVIFSFERQWKKENPWNQYVAGASWEYFSGMGFTDLIKSIEKGKEAKQDPKELRG